VTCALRGPLRAGTHHRHIVEITGGGEVPRDRRDIELLGRIDREPDRRCAATLLSNRLARRLRRIGGVDRHRRGAVAAVADDDGSSPTPREMYACCSHSVS
jgi:hypothetical protein